MRACVQKDLFVGGIRGSNTHSSIHLKLTGTYTIISVNIEL